MWVLHVFCLLMLHPVSEVCMNCGKKIYGVPLQMDFSPIKSHKLLLPLAKDGDDRDVSENYSQGVMSCE